jgi:hypothetical protein
MLYKVCVAAIPNSVVDILGLEMSPSPHPPSLIFPSPLFFFSLALAPWMNIMGM